MRGREGTGGHSTFTLSTRRREGDAADGAVQDVREGGGVKRRLLSSGQGGALRARRSVGPKAASQTPLGTIAVERVDGDSAGTCVYGRMGIFGTASTMHS